MPHVYESIGDLAEGEIIGKLYSQRAEALADLPTDTIDGALQADCLTGVWISTMRPENVIASLPEDAVINLSPGDLDEIVAGFLQFGAKPADVESGEAKTGTAFQRLSAFRAGFFDASNNGLETGLETCLNIETSEPPSSPSCMTLPVARSAAFSTRRPTTRRRR